MFCCCCARSLSSCGEHGLFSSCSARASHCSGSSYCGSWALEHRLSCCSAQDLPGPGIEPVSPALAGRLSSTVQPGKYKIICIVSIQAFFFFKYAIQRGYYSSPFHSKPILKKFTFSDMWSEVSQPCPTLSDPIDGSPPGFSVPGILQARTLEWVAISFSNARKWKVKVKLLSRVRLFRDPIDCSPPGSSVHRIFQARVLEWGAIAFSFSDIPGSQQVSELTQTMDPGCLWLFTW